MNAGDEADAAVGVGRDRALNDGREKRSNKTNSICSFHTLSLRMLNQLGLLFGLADTSASLTASSIFASVGFDRFFSGFLRPEIFKSVCIIFV